MEINGEVRSKVHPLASKVASKDELCLHLSVLINFNKINNFMKFKNYAKPEKNSLSQILKAVIFETLDIYIRLWNEKQKCIKIGKFIGQSFQY